MSVAKGKLFLSIDQLKLICGLPEEVEILAIRPKNSLNEDGFEFLLVSPEETQITQKNVPISLIRRNTIDIQRIEEPQRPIISAQAEIKFNEDGSVTINGAEVKEPEEKKNDFKSIFKDLTKGL